MKISAIYKIQSIIKPERIYIGSAVNINIRWSTHLSQLRNNKHSSKKLQRHFNKYGTSDLQFSILLGCNKEDLIKTEQYFIDSYNPYFNTCKVAGSNLGTHHKCSKEARKRMSESKKGHFVSEETKEKMRIKSTGQKHTDETKTYLSKIRLGTKHTEETKKKLRERLKGKLLGRPKTEEHKKKLREANLGKHPTEETRQKLRIARAKQIRHPHTEETIQKIRHSHLGKIPWNKGAKGLQIAWNKNKKMSDKQKINSGRKKGIIPWNKGLKMA